MEQMHICARCQSEVLKERLSSNPVVCNHCGHASNHHEVSLHKNFQKRLSNTMIISGVVAIALFAHLVHWQNYSLQIVPLKIQTITGLSGRSALLEVADICMHRMKYDCVVTSYTDALRQNPNDLEVMEKLARVQDLMGQNEAAHQTLTRYFSSGGSDALVAHRFAKILQKIGQDADADKFFQLALSLKPDVVQVTVTQDYVRFLMSQARYKDAQKVITERRKAGASQNFLNQEFDEIKSLLNQRS